MSETTTVATNTASKKATQAAVQAATTAAGNLPTVVETAELALEVPSKVVLSERWLVGAGVVVGAAMGAGIFYGVQKFRNRNKTCVVVSVPDGVEEKKA